MVRHLPSLPPPHHRITHPQPATLPPTPQFTSLTPPSYRSQRHGISAEDAMSNLGQTSAVSDVHVGGQVPVDLGVTEQPPPLSIIQATFRSFELLVARFPCDLPTPVATWEKHRMNRTYPHCFSPSLGPEVGRGSIRELDRREELRRVRLRQWVCAGIHVGRVGGIQHCWETRSHDPCCGGLVRCQASRVGCCLWAGLGHLWDLGDFGGSCLADGLTVPR